MKIKKLIANAVLITFVLVLLCSLIPAKVTSGAPPTPIPIGWTPTPQAPSGGGGSSGGGSTAPSDTFPKIVKILNSNGIVIGNATAYNYNDIRAHAEWNVTVGNDTEWVYVDAKLNTIPTSDMRMDIGLETPDKSLLPDFLHPDKMIAQINFTKCSGWSIQDGSYKITVKVPTSAVKGIGAQDSYYLVHASGNEYQLLKVNIAGPDAQGMMTYDATPSRVSLSATGSTSFMLVAVPTSLATPTPTPTPTPAATPTPTPEPSGLGLSTFTLLIMVFIPAVIAGLIIIYYEMLRKK
jgi:hypothetical protein